MSELQTLGEWLDWESSGVELLWSGQTASLRWEGISLEARDVAVRTLRDNLSEGAVLSEALEVVASTATGHPVIRGQALAQDVIVVDASEVTQASLAVDVVKSVSARARGSRRVLAVAGTLDFTGESDYDTLGAFGALMVRLNVDQVFAVGQGARALFLSVGMEGSWDGESRFCEDSDSAYDDIRAHIRPGDVVVVLGGIQEPLTGLADKLKADLS